MWKGVVAAYLIVAFCYLSVAFAGYWAFVPFVEDDVLISLRKPSWLIVIANLMIFIHVVVSYQVKLYIPFNLLNNLNIYI